MDDVLKHQLSRILKPQFHNYIANWFLTATPREKRGVTLIIKILDTNARKVFKVKKPELNSRKLDEAEVEIQRRYM